MDTITISKRKLKLLGELYNENVFNSLDLYYLHIDAVKAGQLQIKDIRSKPYYRSKAVHDFISFVGNRAFFPEDILSFDESYINTAPTILSFIKRRSRVDIAPCKYNSFLFPDKKTFSLQVNILKEDFPYFCRVANLDRTDTEFFKIQMFYSSNPVSRKDFTLAWLKYVILDSNTLWIEDISTDIDYNIKNSEFVNETRTLVDYTLSRFIQTAHFVYTPNIRIILPSTEIRYKYYKDSSKILNSKIHKNGFKLSNTQSEHIKLPGSMKVWKIWVLK